MDRKGKSKVGVLCLFFAVIALIFGGFFCKISYEKNLYEEQKKELSVIYPNLADELRENISYYAEKQMQAVGMSDGQLQIMLQLEGLFYTIGTLLIAVGGGSIAGYLLTYIVGYLQVYLLWNFDESDHLGKKEMFGIAVGTAIYIKQERKKKNSAA